MESEQCLGGRRDAQVSSAVCSVSDSLRSVRRDTYYGEMPLLCLIPGHSSPPATLSVAQKDIASANELEIQRKEGMLQGLKETLAALESEESIQERKMTEGQEQIEGTRDKLRCLKADL